MKTATNSQWADAQECKVGIWIVTLLLLHVLALGRNALAGDQPSPSLHSDVPFVDCIHREYRIWHGLPSDTILDVLQTRDGYLWIATSNGLVRFDGSRFTTFNRSNTQLPSNNVLALCEGRDGALWIGTEGGLAKKDHHTGAVVRISALDGARIMTIFEANDSAVWVGTAGPTWRSHDRSQFQVVKNAPRVVYNYCEDLHGTLWIAAERGLYKVTPSGFQAQANRPAEATPLRILANEDGTMWIGTAKGLFHFHDGIFELKLPGFIWDIRQTRTGGLYVIATAALHRLVGDTFETLTEFESMVCLAEDREGGLWVGKVDGEGLHYYRNQRIRFLPLGERRPLCLLEDRQRRMWIGSDIGLHRWADGKLTDFGEAHGVPNAPVPALARSKGDAFWIGTGKGLLRWTGTEFIPHFEVADFAIACLHESRDGSLWIGAHHDEVIYRLDRNQLHKVARFDGSVNCFYEDEQGRLWVGTRIGIFRQSRDGFELVNDVSLNRLGSSHFQCFHADDDGSLWIGTRGGLARYRPATSRSETDRFDIFTSREGLAADYIERLHFDNHGNLWMGGRHGFFSVTKDDLEAVAAGKLARVQSNTLEETEMLTHWAVGSRGGPTTYLASNGKLWMSVGLTAAIMGDPAHTYSGPPPIYIENVRVDDRTVNLDQPVEFLSGPRRLAVDFSAPTFADPDQIQIQYRLEGHDEDWISAGNERVAYYTDLPPGHYNFRLITDNGHGVRSAEEAAIGFTVNPRWFETAWFRAFVALGMIASVVVSVQRYTAGVRRRNVLLSESEARFRNMADSSPMLIWTSGPDRGCTYVNTTWLAFTGRTLEDELGYGWAEGIHPDDRERCLATSRAAFDRRKEFQMTYRLRTFDGEYRWVLDYGSPRFEPDGAFAGFIGSAFDITERKQAVEALRESERRYEEASQVAHFGYWHRSLHDNTGYWSPQLYRIFGVDPDCFDPSFEEVLKLVHPDDRNTLRNALQQAGTDRKPIDVEYRIQRPDGSERIAHSVAEVVVGDETGEAVAVTGVVQDITKRKHAEEEALRNREQLIRVGRAASMGELTTSIAHEVKQPLFAIVSNAQTAKRMLDCEQPDVQEIREALEDIASDGKRASDVIDHIRSLVRKEDRPKHRLDLNDVAGDVIKTALPELHRRGLGIRSELADTLPAVHGDPIELQQVILNLIINGAQAMSQGNSKSRALLVSTTTNNDAVELAVTDSGVGLNDTQVERIFEPFYTTKQNGTGMGLAINRTIIEAHGGRIWATSNPDRGATFRFSLPISSGHSQ